MKFEHETGWNLHPLEGKTGHAFMGVKDQQKIFVKLNTSPFLAALSVEGVAPRLMWTKRIGNGDILTAQEWCNGRTLKRDEMFNMSVAHILKRVHKSPILKRVLSNLRSEAVGPEQMLTRLNRDLMGELALHPQIKAGLQYLHDSLGSLNNFDDFTVCHGDLSHKNWLLSDQDNLYLVDWDSVVMADPAYDVGQLMARYLEFEGIDPWLAFYNNKESNEDLKNRSLWYGIFSLIVDCSYYYKKMQFKAMNDCIIKLDYWLNQIEN